jgi:hypothetical protein
MILDLCSLPDLAAGVWGSEASGALIQGIDYDCCNL